MYDSNNDRVGCLPWAVNVILGSVLGASAATIPLALMRGLPPLYYVMTNFINPIIEFLS